MAVTVSTFKVAFPEFSKAGDAMLTAQLAQAELEVSDSFGDRRDLVVMLTLADNLANSPWGRDARMVPVNKVNGAQMQSTYAVRLQALKEVNAVSGSRFGSATSTLYY